MDDTTPSLEDRIRAALSTHSPVREQRMFGALCFMLDNKLLIGTWKGGGLLVRIDPDRNAELLGQPGASVPEMGPGRSMGSGWISVDADAADDDLEFWIEQALEFNPRAKASR